MLKVLMWLNAVSMFLNWLNTGRFGHALRQIGTCVIKAFIESRESRKTPHNIGSVAIAPEVVYVISVLSIIFVLAWKWRSINATTATSNNGCSQLYRLSTQRLNIDFKPKEVLIEAVNRFLKEKLNEKGFVFSCWQLKFTKKLKDVLISKIVL